ncbi:MAG TPA: flagellar basal body P-ring formation chaperone FlgA, partial [Phycisphaerae bacterium]|nr:flagellar basal body P-ring formation chaperone FlgA [Phycisphaerae bacterium]
QDAKGTNSENLGVSRSASVGMVACLLTGWAAMSALAACALGAEPAGARPETPRNAPAVIRMYSAAVVTDDAVRLSDVADVEGEAVDLAGSWVVASAPAVGSTKEVTVDQVERLLSQKGANLSQMMIRGPSRCTVSRPKSRVSAGSQPASASIAGAHADAGELVRDEANVDPASLEAAVRSHLGRKLAGLGGVPVIKFSPGAGRVLALKRPAYEFKVTDRSESSLGLVPIEVTVSEKDHVVQTLPMLVQVSLKKQVVVAARAINRSQRIGTDDLTAAERTFDRVEEMGLGEPGPLIGQQAKRPVGRGEQISLKDVEPVPLVQRNDLVTVWVRLGGVTVRGAAKAMSSGTYGQVVTLKNEASTQTFTATVTGPRTAEVPADATTASADGARERVR